MFILIHLVVVFLPLRILLRLCEFLLPEIVGFSFIHIREDKIVHIAVPIDRLAFNAFFDVLDECQYARAD